MDDIAAVAPDAVVVDVYSEARTVRYFHMSALDANGARCHIFGQAFVRRRAPPPAGPRQRNARFCAGAQHGDAFVW